jgi:hypothetical protein
VQTFLPYPSFYDSAKCLDYRRLGKQRIEAYQIFRTLSGLSHGWARHPAVRMWHGHKDALTEYMNACITEWVLRGYKNSISRRHTYGPVTMPIWIGDKKFHSSHRSNLLRKFPEHYSKFGWTEPTDLKYFWPV